MVAKYAACGPPYPMGTPNLWVFPTTASAPNSPGGVSSVRLNKSEATIVKIFFLCACSIKSL